MSALSSGLPEVSGVIPCYNYGRFLKRSVRSLQKQTVPLKEIVVVDDGSTDAETRQVIDALAEEGTVRYLRFEKNRGPSAARNAGFEAVDTEYVLILDADDFFDPRFVELALPEFKGRVGAVGANSIVIDESNISKETMKYAAGGIVQALYSWICAASYVIRKKAWRDAEGFDEKFRFFEDNEFLVRLTKEGWRVAVLDQPLHYYYRHEASTCASTGQEVLREGHKHIYQKHKHLYHKYVYAGLGRVFKETLTDPRRLRYPLSPMLRRAAEEHHHIVPRVLIYIWCGSRKLFCMLRPRRWIRQFKGRFFR